MKRRKALLMVSSLFLVGCGGVARPHILLCIVNAPAKHRLCYQADRDYDANGKLLPGAVPIIRANATLEDLNKLFTVDSVEPSPTGFVDAFASLKAWVKQLRNHLKNCTGGQ
jgi:hypothetical protein